jgi:succinate dehydrogenase flavin-adding protein (antitoxin of CptAB toxin-antitoxin module)
MSKQIDYMPVNTEQYSLQKDIKTDNLEKIIESIILKIETFKGGQEIDAILSKFMNKGLVSLTKKDIKKLQSYYLLICSDHYFSE